MKRVLCFLALTAAVMAFPASHLLMSAGNASPKVDVCHNGQVINVSENAVEAHLQHGDCTADTDPVMQINQDGSCECVKKDCRLTSDPKKCCFERCTVGGVTDKTCFDKCLFGTPDDCHLAKDPQACCIEKCTVGGVVDKACVEKCMGPVVK